MGVYKVVAALASLALVALVWNIARLRGTDPVRAAALVGLNPLLVIYGIGGGHNDLLMLVAMVAAIYAVLASRERLGGAFAVLAIGIKLTAGLLLPFAIAAGGRRRGRSRRRDFLVGAGAMFALIASVSVAVFGSGAAHLLVTVQRTQSEGDWHSIPGFVTTRLHLVTLGHIVGYVLAAAFVGVSIWLLRRVWQGRQDWIVGGRLGDAGDAGGRQFAFAVVRGLGAAAGGGRTRPPPVPGGAGDHRGGVARPGARVHSSRWFICLAGHRRSSVHRPDS